jgi:hypothetical protein
LNASLARFSQAQIRLHQPECRILPCCCIGALCSPLGRQILRQSDSAHQFAHILFASFRRVFDLLLSALKSSRMPYFMAGFVATVLIIVCQNSSTKPDAFFLDVFFNAQASQTEPKDKSRPPNALVPTVIAYAGGQMDFTVDMGPEVP